jgi:hypothetical protein
MSAGAIAAIIVAVVVVLLIIAGLSAARRRRLQQRFGPEYDRMVGEKHSHRKAEAELSERERRVRNLDIRPLDETTRARYAGEWASIQELFVDQPGHAVAQAGLLVTSVMKDRGYPTEDYEQILADLSVEHANTLDHYRAAHGVSLQAESGSASTEDLRLAMLHYRALFGDLLGQPSPAAGDTAAAGDSSGAGDIPVVGNAYAGGDASVAGDTAAVEDAPAAGNAPAADDARSAVPGPRTGPAS